MNYRVIFNHKELEKNTYSFATKASMISGGNNWPDPYAL